MRRCDGQHEAPTGHWAGIVPGINSRLATGADISAHGKPGAAIDPARKQSRGLVCARRRHDGAPVLAPRRPE